MKINIYIAITLSGNISNIWKYGQLISEYLIFYSSFYDVYSERYMINITEILKI